MSPIKELNDREDITYNSSEIEGIEISDIPKNVFIEVVNYDKDTDTHILMFEGCFGWYEDHFFAFVDYTFPRKYWDFPLGLSYHMDLMMRLIEYRADKDGDVFDITLDDDGAFWSLGYNILIPHNNLKTLKEAFDYADKIVGWADGVVNNTQDHISDYLSNTIIPQYNKTALLSLPELIVKVQGADNSDEKGKYLEELVAQLFSMIDGFTVIERKRTKTEEIDLVILNKSSHSFWRSESNLILVECKNWDKKVGKNEYVAFREKLENRRGRAKLGFFVSANGFARTFAEEDLRNSKEDLLIVPIDLKQLMDIADQQKDFSEELQKMYVNASTR